MPESEEKYNKVGYDGRLEYYKHLRSYWDAFASSSLNEDYNKWRLFLRGYFSRTRAYMKPEEKDKIASKFNTINNELNQINFCYNDINKRLIESHILNDLQEIEDLLFTATKDMLLPTKTEDDDSFDIERFRRESGL